MNPERWHVRSLRRFEDSEIALAVYLFLGGICSLLYTGGAIWQTRLYTYIFSDKIASNFILIGKVLLHIVVNAIVRVITWAPDMLTDIMINHHRFLDWLFAANILKDFS